MVVLGGGGDGGDFDLPLLGLFLLRGGIIDNAGLYHEQMSTSTKGCGCGGCLKCLGKAMTRSVGDRGIFWQSVLKFFFPFSPDLLASKIEDFLTTRTSTRPQLSPSPEKSIFCHSLQ